MSSNTAPSPLVASASEDTGTGAELAFKAFDDDINTHWQTANGTVTGHLIIDLGSGNGIAPTSFRLGAPETPDRPPNDFTIQGSNNGTDYTVLTTYTGFSTPTPTARTFSGFAPISAGNNFAAHGVTSDDQVSDTPTLNYPTWNSRVASSLGGAPTFSIGNLGVARGDGGVIATFGVSSGKWYWEVSKPS